MQLCSPQASWQYASRTHLEDAAMAVVELAACQPVLHCPWASIPSLVQGAESSEGYSGAGLCPVSAADRRHWRHLSYAGLGWPYVHLRKVALVHEAFDPEHAGC